MAVAGYKQWCSGGEVSLDEAEAFPYERRAKLPARSSNPRAASSSRFQRILTDPVCARPPAKLWGSSPSLPEASVYILLSEVGASPCYAGYSLITSHA